MSWSPLSKGKYSRLSNPRELLLDANIAAFKNPVYQRKAKGIKFSPGPKRLKTSQEVSVAANMASKGNNFDARV